MLSSFENKRHKRRKVVSDINVTPFVDVLLVLLVIFMITAPMMNSLVEVDLPKGMETTINEKESPINISIKMDGTIFLQDEQIKLGLISRRLTEISGHNLSNKIFIRADKKIDYGRVMEVVRMINVAGFSQVAFVTEYSND